MRALVAVVLAWGLSGCVIYLNPLCTDQIRNGDETGVDCGGTCGKCDLGQHCNVDGDCDGGNCKGGVCTAPPCENGVKDGAETDIDCGGGTCSKCAGGRTCKGPTDCFSGTCTASGVCSSLTVSFAPETRYFSGFKSYALVSTDLDGDGVKDLAVINEYGSSIAVFLNDYGRGGSFSRKANPGQRPVDEPDTRATNFGPTGAYPTGGGTGDFNHDGKFDIVTADYHGNSISVLLNAGGGLLNLRPVASYPTVTNAQTSNLAVGDLDNDGNLDVVATNPVTSSVSLFRGRMDGTFEPGTTIPVGVNGAAQPYSAAIGDFNGDGKNDLAIAEETSGTIVVRLGNGDGTFQAEVPYEIGGARDYIIIYRDMNNDQIPDLVCANRSGDSVSVLLSRGDGTFRKSIVTKVTPPGFTPDPGKGAPFFGPYNLAVGDINADGVPDIITPNFLRDSVSILLGIGNGHFDPPIELNYGPPDPPATATVPYGVVIDDFNHDGKLDFATCNAESDDLAVRLNNGQ